MSWLKNLPVTLRMLTRKPGYSFLVITILAVTIGANAAIFTLIYTVLLRPLPYPDADRLVSVTEENPTRGQINGAAPPNFRDWSQNGRQFESLVALTPGDLVVPRNSVPRRVRVLFATPGFLASLGAQMAYGRTLQLEDSISGSSSAVVSHGFWTQFLDSDPQPIGRTVQTSSQRLTVVGVLPADFYYPDRFDLLLPLTFEEEALTDAMRGARYLQVLGKLKPGVSLGQARDELEVLTGGVAQNRDWSPRLTPLYQEIVGDQGTQLWLLAAAVGFLLLVACSNVGGLALSRMASRRQELGLRAALGARRSQLVAQILLEMSVLFLSAGMAGLLLAGWTLDGLLLLAPRELPRTENLGLGWPVLLFTLGLSLACGLVFGLLPALRSTDFRRLDLARIQTRGIVPSSIRSRRFLVVAEVALSLVLLISAGLLTRSLLRLQRVDIGFRPEGAAAFSLAFSTDRYPTDAARVGFVDQLLQEVGSVPQVAGIAASTNLPLSGSSMSFGYRVPGFEDSGEQFAQYHATTPGYFKTMGIPVVAGREFTPGDRQGGTPVALVSESLARNYWPGESAVGKKLIHASRSGLQERVIVGVVKSVRHSSLVSTTPAEIYVPYAQDAWSFLSFVVRFSEPDPVAATAVRERVWEIDSSFPLDRFDSLNLGVERSQAPLRFRTTLLGFFAIVSLLLACIGVYAVLSQMVSQNTRPIGVRMALGANRRRILQEVLAGGLGMVGAGILVGLLGSLAASRLLASFLFEVTPLDPWTLAGVTLLFLGAAIVACLVPAGRATTIDPVVALRQE